MIISEPQIPNNQENPSTTVDNSIELSKVPEKPQKGNGILKSILAVAIIIVIAVVLLALYFTGTLSHLISYSVTSKTTFSSVNSFVQLNNVVTDLVNSSNAFNISYTGSYLNESTNSSLFGSSESRQFINSSIAKYGNSFEIFFNTTPLGSVQYILQNRTNLTYCGYFYGIYCSSYLVNFTPSQYIVYNYINSIITGSVNQTSNLINNPAPVPGTISNGKIRVKYLGQYTYNGNNCSKVLSSLNASFDISNVTGKENSSLVLCYSDVFGLPLDGHVNTSISLTEDGLNVSGNIYSVIVSHINPAPTSYNQLTVPVAKNNQSLITTGNNPAQSSINGSSCSNFTLSLSNYPSHVYGECSWSGGNLSLTYAGGTAGYASISIVGQNGQTYFSNSTTEWGNCYYGNANNVVYLPAQDYTIRLGAGKGGGACGNAFVTLS
ncbi:hypothetical protein M1558_04425 [Candidatus Parvarchaeota archaeon]|nr:hypothetical protein [Candidatus Parvarchaeota archaeon]